MSETMTETPTTPTEGTTSSEAGAETLLTSSESTTTPQQQQGDPAPGDKPAGEEAKVEETKPEGAPESYDFKAPEGKEYDSAVLEPFSAAAKEANLTQETAQKILDKMAPVLAERQLEQVKAVQAGWLQATTSDPEFGGEKLQENLALASKSMKTFATPELTKLLNETGLGNHPEVIRLMVKVGKSISEDGFVNGRTSAAQPRDIGAILYDNTAKGAK